MAGFEDLIRGTLKKHGDSTPQSRAAIYDSSRQALERMLSQNQNLDLAAQSLQRQRLEKSIADIEASYQASGGVAPQAPAPTPPAAPPAAAAPSAVSPSPSSPSPSPPPPPPPPAAPKPMPAEPAAVVPPVAMPPASPPATQTPPPIPVLEPRAPEAAPAPTAAPTAAPTPTVVPQAPVQPPVSPAAPAVSTGRVEPGFDVPPVPVPPSPPSVASVGEAPVAAPPPLSPPSPPPSPQARPAGPTAGSDATPSPVAGADAYSDAVAAQAVKDRKPYAKLLLWTIIVVGIGVSIWWAISFGPALLRQQLGGSVPNPGQTIESGQFVPGEEGEGWVVAFNPADDSINIDTGGRGTAEVVQNAGETFVRLASNAGGNDNNLKVLIPRGVMLPLMGSAATIEVVLKSSDKASQEFAIYCEFGSMGSCGRKRFTAPGRPDAQIFDVLLNNVGLAADEDAYLTFNTDMGGEGRGIDLYAIRFRLNR